MVLPLERRRLATPNPPAAQTTRVLVSTEDGRFLTEAELTTQSRSDGPTAVC